MGTHRHTIVNIGKISFLIALVVLLPQFFPSRAVSSPAQDKVKAPAIDALSDLPPGAAPAIAWGMQRDLAKDMQLQRKDNIFFLSNPIHGLDILFASQGPAISSAGGSWGMSMSGYGCPGSVRLPRQAMISNDDGRMLYARGEITEWYVNSQWGIEQGFTIAEAPCGTGGSGLVVELGLSGDLHPRLEGNTLIMADGQGREAVRYTGLQAFDANGKNLPAHLTLEGRTLGIRVEDGGASYPVTIDPWIQKAKLTAADRAADDWFGCSVAISGETIVVGARQDDDNGNASGSVYVFVRPASGWANAQQTAKLTPDDGAELDIFGYSVAISGETIVVGAYGDDDRGSMSGSAYVFVRPTDGWADMHQTAKLTASDGAADDQFGKSVAISGNTIVSGAQYDDDNGANSGSAYVFVKPAGGWTDMNQTAKLRASDGDASDYFGTSVAVSDENIVVGAHFDDDAGNQSGSAYVFVRPASGWANINQTAKLTASDGDVNVLFGYSVAISGETIAVGAYYDDAKGYHSGSAYVFVRPAGGWADMNQTAKLTASDGAEYDLFGLSVAISDETIVIGAYGDDDRGPESGTAYVFSKPTSGWADMSQSAKLTAADGVEEDEFGYSVAISGNTVVVGAVFDDERTGSAYVVELPAFPWAMFLPAMTNNVRQ